MRKSVNALQFVVWLANSSSKSQGTVRCILNKVSNYTANKLWLKQELLHRKIFVTQKSVSRNFFNHYSWYKRFAWLNMLDELKIKVQQVMSSITSETTQAARILPTELPQAITFVTYMQVGIWAGNRILWLRFFVAFVRVYSPRRLSVGT